VIDRVHDIANLVSQRSHYRESFDWHFAEEELGLAFPSDYKNLADLIGPGIFSGYLEILLPRQHEAGVNIVSAAQKTGSIAALPEYAGLYAPYVLYPKRAGLIKWAVTTGNEEFFWDTSPPGSDDWTIVTRDENEWNEYKVGTTDFVYRILHGSMPPFSDAVRDFGGPVFESFV
jgi:hypothetical protein